MEYKEFNDRLNLLRSFYERYKWYDTGNQFYQHVLFSDYHRKYTQGDGLCTMLIEFLNYKVKCDQLFTQMTCLLNHLECEEQIAENHKDIIRWTELLEFLQKPIENDDSSQ